MQTVLLADVSCTKVHNVTGNKYKFAQIVQETATNDHIIIADGVICCLSQNRHLDIGLHEGRDNSG